MNILQSLSEMRLEPMNQSPSTPDLGFGISLRPAYFREVIERRPDIDHFEIISEDFNGVEGWPRDVVEQIAKHYSIVMHGVSLSIGGSDPLDFKLVAKLRELAERIGARLVSDHLCWTGVGGIDTHDLLPLPLTDRALRHVVERVRAAQDAFGRRLVIENPSTYLTFAESSMPEWEFVGRLSEEADCRLLLDVNNVYVSACNHGFDPFRYIEAISPPAVVQIHLGGHRDLGRYLLDTHDQRVSEIVWELYAQACRRLGPISTTLEWDTDLPTLAVLESELARAKALRQQACLEGTLPSRTDDVRMVHPRSSTPIPRLLADAPAELSALQHALQAEILSRAGASEPAQRNSREESLAPARRVTREEGLDIYARAYKARHLRCLRDGYPVLNELLGRDFESLALDYLARHSPGDASLQTLLNEFAPYLQERRSPDELWADIVAQVASFDLAVRLVRESPSLERSGDPPAEDPRTVSAEEMARLRVRVTPCLRLLAFEYARYLPSFCERAGVQVQWSGADGKHIAVYRRDYEVRAVFLEKTQYGVLRGLARGLRLAEAIERHAVTSKDECAARLMAAHNWHRQWMAAGFYVPVLSHAEEDKRA